MLEVAIGQGVGAMVLTPHLRPFDGPEKEEEHCGRFAELQEAVRDAGLEIDLHLWSEIAFRFNMPEVAAWPSGHLADAAYVLTDLPPGPLSPGLEQAYFRAALGRLQAHTRPSRAPSPAIQASRTD